MLDPKVTRVTMETWDLLASWDLPAYQDPQDIRVFEVRKEIREIQRFPRS
jgi:hypothetical protein